MDYTVIFSAFLALLGTIITAFLVPWIRAKTTLEERSNITKWIDVAVTAAEQIFASGMGEEKLCYVIKFLAELGISVTTAEIESSVYWLTNSVTDGLEVDVDGDS